MSGQTTTTRRSRFAWMRAAIEHRSASLIGIVILASMGFLGWSQSIPNTTAVVTVLLVIVFEFQKRLDQGVPLLQLTSMIAVLQWLVGPLLNYSSDMTFGRYSMYVSEAEYFSFALPATSFYVALMLAVGASVRQKALLQSIDNNNFMSVGIVLALIAAGATFAAGSDAAGGGLSFVLHLLSQLRYVAALYFLFSKSPLRLLLAAASCSQLFVSSLGTGMFHDLILWIAILFCYWFAKRDWNVVAKGFVLSAAAGGLFAIQVVKAEYRSLIARGEDPSLFGMMVDYLTPGGRAWETSALSLAITRLNQGWIISAVMRNCPEFQPFVEGETIRDAFTASLVPRFLVPDKKTAGGRENFRRFTGLPIQNETSMSISPLGEAYCNFGAMGGITFMFLFGAAFAVTYAVTLRYSLKHPTFLFWIPLIFYQAMKAETEMTVIVNQLTKGGLIALVGHGLIVQVFPERWKRSNYPGQSSVSRGQQHVEPPLPQPVVTCREVGR